LQQLPTSVKPAAAYGVTLSFNRGRGRELDLVAIDQETTASRQDPFGLPLSAKVNVLYLQIGGRYILDPDARMRPYVAGTIGGTRLSVDSLATFAPSLALGGGAEVQLSRAIALRVDGRVHVTLANGSTNVQCDSSGTCAGTTSGSGFTQFVASAGLAFRF